MKKDFKKFLSQLSETNATLDYFVDFNKIGKNVDKIKIKLNQLNYLLGHQDIQEGIRQLYKENPKTFDGLSILIAVRDKDKKKTINNDNQIVPLSSYYKTPELIYEFIQETGLVYIFANKSITNLVDYVFGIEVGLDTNTRKNRGGKNMEKKVARIFKNNSIDFQEQVKHTDFPELLSLGIDVKQFDYAIQTKKKTYLIETNYYNTGGSKLNETSRAYTDIAAKINQYSNFEFVWITDGKGWLTAKSKLEEAYNNIAKVYNLTSINEFINLIKAEIE